MKNPISLLALAATVALAPMGCQSPGAKPPINTTKYDHENRLKFVLLDRGAQRSVTSSGMQVRRLEDDRLEVAANVRNRQNRRIQVQINCEFKDAQGFVVDSTPFETLILSENEQRTARFTSLNNKAVDYTIRVQQAR
jgi:Protein of unknown function (DUF1425)